jgi:hypothetical protein
MRKLINRIAKRRMEYKIKKLLTKGWFGQMCINCWNCNVAKRVYYAKSR